MSNEFSTLELIEIDASSRADEIHRAPKLTRQRPFRGLVSYQDQEEDHKLLAGRKDDIENLFDLVKYNTLVTFYGYSGTGKTSVLNAGLLPRLRAEGFVPIYVRLDFNCSTNLVQQIKDTIEANSDWRKNYDGKFFAVNASEHGKELTETLWEYFMTFSHGRLRKPPVLIFDQFEEIFTLSSKSVHASMMKELINELKCLIENQIPTEAKSRIEGKQDFNPGTPQNFRVMFSIREDYLSKLNRLKDRIYSLDKAKYGLDHLKKEQVEEVIDTIQKVFGVRYFDNDAIKYLIIELDKFSTEREDRIDPLSMSLLLFQLNETRIKENRDNIPLSTLQGLKLDKVMGKYYTNAVDRFPRRVQRIIEKFLINSNGDKLLVPESTLINEGLRQKEILKLVHHDRVLRYEKRLGITSVEIVHDSLARAILKIRNERKVIKTVGITASVVAAFIIMAFYISYRITEKAETEKQALLRDASRTIQEADRKFQEAESKIQAAELKRSEANKYAMEKQKEVEDEKRENAALQRANQKRGKDLIDSRRIADSMRIQYEVQKIKAENESANAIAQTAEAKANYRKYLEERVRLLKLNAQQFLEKEPGDPKRAFLYALKAHQIDSSKEALELLVEAYWKMKGSFYTKFGNVYNDTVRILLANGDEVVFDSWYKMGYKFRHADNSRRKIALLNTVNDQFNPKLTRQMNLKMPSNSSLIDLVREQYTVDLSSDERYLITYGQSSRTFTIWDNTGPALSEVAVVRNASRPLLSQNNSYAAYYDDSKFRVTLGPDFERIKDLRRESNWEVTQINLDLKANPEHYAVLRTSQKTGKKEVILRDKSGRSVMNTIAGTPQTGKLLSMDYLPETGKLLVYFERQVMIFTNGEPDDGEKVTWKGNASGVLSYFDQKTKRLVIIKVGKSSELIVLDSKANHVVNAGLTFDDEMPFLLRVEADKVMLLLDHSPDSELLLIDIQSADPKILNLRVHAPIEDANFYLGKYIYFKTNEAFYLWHFRMKYQWVGTSDLEDFYNADRKEFPEFWKLTSSDEILNVTGK